MEHTLQTISERGEWEIPAQELATSDVLGNGSFGCVLLGMWRGTPVAAKVINTGTHSSIDELHTELNTLARMHHPNIIQLLGACTMSEPYTIIMELMPTTLEKEIRNRSLTATEKHTIAIDIARGLAYMHNRRPNIIIHRDLKPSNILLTVSKKAKLADFGISMIQVDKGTPYKMTGETGTLRYMAPEVLVHEAYSANVDIWSFGMVLYHMHVSIPYWQYAIPEIVQMISHYNTPLIPEPCDPNVVRVMKMCWKHQSDRPDALQLITFMNTYCPIDSKTKQKPKQKRWWFCVSS